MDKIKDFRGKIVQVDLQLGDGTIEKRVGIILNQKNNRETGCVTFTMLESSGSKTTFPARVSKLNQLKSVRLSHEERTAFEETYKAYTKLQAFLNKYEKEKHLLETDLNRKKTYLKTFSDALTFHDFSSSIQKLFHEKFYDKYGVSIEHSGSAKDACIMSVTKECGKWLNFNSIPFVIQEYDGEYFVDSQYPEYDQYCKTHGPKSIPELDGLYESYYEASVGDKRSLYVSLNYKVPLKYGITKSSLRDIAEALDSVLRKNTCIDKKIEAASNQNSHKERARKPKETELVK